MISIGSALYYEAVQDLVWEELTRTGSCPPAVIMSVSKSHMLKDSTLIVGRQIEKSCLVKKSKYFLVTVWHLPYIVDPCCSVSFEGGCYFRFFTLKPFQPVF